MNQMLIFKKDDKQKTKPILIRNMMQNTTSMIEKFPDAINCGGGDFTVVFFLTSAVNILAIYRYVWHDRTLEVQFNGDGTYRLEHSLNNYKHYTKGCINQSIQQLYIQGRAFNLVNDPTQAQQLQKQGEEIKLLKEAMQKLAKENRIQKEKNSFLENQIKQILEKIENLDQTCNDPSKLDSSECFEMFKGKNIEMCIANIKTRVVPVEELKECNDKKFCVSSESWTVTKHDNESDYDACTRSFSEKGFAFCSYEEYSF